MMVPKSFVNLFANLDDSDRTFIIAELLSLLAPVEDKVNRARHMAKEVRNVFCPHCQSRDIQGNGTCKGIQRYVCVQCKKYFRETSGKVVYALKKGELLPEYLANMLLGYSIRKCARRTGISIQTSFDWRHKILSAFNEAVPRGFEAIVESDDIFFPESFKGSRKLPEKARKRGKRATRRGINRDEQVAVVVSCDRRRNKELRVAARGRIGTSDLEKILDGKLENAETLCTDLHASYAAYSLERSIEHQPFQTNTVQRVKDKACHVQNVKKIGYRLREWMRRFHGVATKYLQNYLNWFMILERIKNERQQLQSFAFFTFVGQNTWHAWRNISCTALI